jgi:hypothetical protein
MRNVTVPSNAEGKTARKRRILSSKGIRSLLFRFRFLGLRSIKHSAHVVRTPQTTSLASFSVNGRDE